MVQVIPVTQKQNRTFRSHKQSKHFLQMALHGRGLAAVADDVEEVVIPNKKESRKGHPLLLEVVAQRLLDGEEGVADRVDPPQGLLRLGDDLGAHGGLVEVDSVHPALGHVVGLDPDGVAVVRDGLAQKVKIGGGRLPDGSIRALKLR